MNKITNKFNIGPKKKSMADMLGGALVTKVNKEEEEMEAR